MRINRHLKEILKAFLMVPYLFVISLPEILYAEKDNQELTELIWYGIFGRISSGNIHAIILTLDNLGILILYCLIYGNYISQFFDEKSIFIFTRVDNRSGWTASKIQDLIIYTTVYSGIFLFFKYCVSLRRVEAISFDRALARNLFVIWLFLIILLITAGMLMNLIALFNGTSIGIAAVILAILILEFVTILYFDNTINIICNPLCYNMSILTMKELGKWKIVVESFYFIVLSFTLGKCIERWDI